MISICIQGADELFPLRYMFMSGIGCFGTGYTGSASEAIMMKSPYIQMRGIHPIDDKGYCDEIEEFLQGEKKVDYSYIYPGDERELSRQVPHPAPINDKGHKPVYINMFSKLSAAWDMHEIEKSVRILADDFLHMDVEKVEFLEIPTYEETKLSYEQDYAPFVNAKFYRTGDSSEAQNY